MKKQRKNSGFTLVEILIVVIILGILAAIVIPQFTEASTEARESTLTSNLQVLRSQSGLYKIQHRDAQPGDTDADNLADDAADFALDLTVRTDLDGTTNVATGALGPYMQQVPNNPFVTLTNPKFEILAIGETAADAALDGSTHWAFVPDTGSIIANDGGSTSAGTSHASL